MTSILRREMTARLLSASRKMPVIVVSGLRQTGKSTLLRDDPEMSKFGEYTTLDDFAALAAARANPDEFITKANVIDEVQRCPELLISIKRSVDARRQAGKYILSGSANLTLLSHVAESLAGRASYFTLFPMTRREINAETGKPPFLIEFMQSGDLPSGRAKVLTSQDILLGGLPPVCLTPGDDPFEWFRGYVQTYVERDIRQISQITDFVGFRTFVNLAAARTGQVLVISNLARDAKLSAATAGRYLQLLETTFLIQKLPPFLKNRSSRLIKSPKLYFTDSGLAAHLCGIREFDPRRDEPLRGALVETYMAQNLAAILEAHAPNAQLSYWNEQGRHEVDFIIENGKRVFAIEVKSAERWNDSDLASLRAFVDRTPACEAAILAYNGKEAVKLDGKLYAIPMGWLIS